MRAPVDKAEMYERVEGFPRQEAGNAEIGGDVPLAQPRPGRDLMGGDARAQAVNHLFDIGAGRFGGDIGVAAPRQR
jgi:hypothetical protein